MKAIQRNKSQLGFTIVELLIVIVVIGILATITIVAFNGIQNRARASEASSALSQAVKKIKVWQVDNSDQTPSDLATVGVTDSNNVSYQYKPGINGSYCITATSGTTSYKISETGTATSGACAGHGSGGVAPVTNIAVNPAATSSYNHEWAIRYGMSRSWITSALDGPSGLTTYARYTQPSASSGSGRGVDHGGNIDLASASFAGSSWQVTANEPITFSSYVRSSQALTNMGITVRVHDNSGTWLTPRVVGTPNSLSANSWSRISYTYVPPVSGYIQFGSRTEQSLAWPAGATIDVTGLMITRGSTLYNYADGNSPGWAWNGTSNYSISTGPPQ